MEPRQFSPLYESNEVILGVAGKNNSKDDRINSFIQSSPYIDEAIAFKYGYASSALRGIIEGIIKRLQKNSIEKWKHRIRREKGQPSYYKYIESQSVKNSNRKLTNTFDFLSKAYTNRISDSIAVIHKYINYKKKANFLAGIHKILDLKNISNRVGFNLIKKYSIQKFSRKRYVKERISWAIMVLKNSKGFGVKKCFRKWQKWTHLVETYSKLNINVQITRYKV